MRNFFTLIRATNWQYLFLYQLHSFQNRAFWRTFHKPFSQKHVLVSSPLPPPYFLFVKESFHRCLLYDGRKLESLYALRSGFSNGRFFMESFFLRSRVQVRVRFFDDDVLKYASAFNRLSVMIRILEIRFRDLDLYCSISPDYHLTVCYLKMIACH